MISLVLRNSFFFLASRHVAGSRRKKKLNQYPVVSNSRLWAGQLTRPPTRFGCSSVQLIFNPGLWGSKGLSPHIRRAWIIPTLTCWRLMTISQAGLSLFETVHEALKRVCDGPIRCSAFKPRIMIFLAQTSCSGPEPACPTDWAIHHVDIQDSLSRCRSFVLLLRCTTRTTTWSTMAYQVSYSPLQPTHTGTGPSRGREWGVGLTSHSLSLIQDRMIA
jgi:hypothetical protein